jgi:hypothetical protein
MSALVAAVLLPVAVLSCSSSSSSLDPDAVTGPTTSRDRADVVTSGPLPCESHPPGVVLSREQAIVQFDPERVCPGYVTVVVGTPVSFVNQGDTAASITVTETATTGVLGATLLDVSVGPGEYVEYTPDAAGFLAFSSDALPSFRGTVEVQAANPA